MPSTPPPSEPLLIVGASARAAAFSARRAGFRPLAADKFGDADLLASCLAERVAEYPRGVLDVAEHLPPGPWIYTGAWENHPGLIDRLRARRPLYGNPGRVVRRVRDPRQWTGAVRDEGLPYLEISDRPPDAASAAAGRWLSKPRHSCGGCRIALVPDVARLRRRTQSEITGPSGTSVTNGAARHRGLTPHVRPDDFYYQRYQAGLPAAALFVADGRRAVLLAATQQLIGTGWAGASGFQYAGSLGPLRLAAEAEDQLRRLGDCLARRFALVGLFGVDWILADGCVWPVEVNPRYTASVEVVERARGLAAIALHVRACRDGILPAAGAGSMERCAGKAILYARRPLVVPPALTEFVRRANAGGDWPVLADVPFPETRIAAGEPVLTVLADGSSLDEVERGLRRRAEEVEAVLGLSGMRVRTAECASSVRCHGAEANHVRQAFEPDLSAWSGWNSLTYFRAGATSRFVAGTALDFRS